ncbi:MAG: FAD-dependent thymidylate synthase, partial [Candidatus Delongbacteria bacterium]|nr:FAD-dependent thymidylate synthase [Candidatus Delongbacteria bacterium]
MIINLAGFNVDYDILKELDGNQNPALTPETFSAAYARISRSEKDITTLRQEACRDVAKARQSNKTIIFEMGHHSVAEHAVFNFDIMEVSRLALEELESFRLVSYMEKSQRYVKLHGDYHIPDEVDDPHSRREFKQMIESQNRFYRKAIDILKLYFKKILTGADEEAVSPRLIENCAKEDARYILPLATLGQVGLTINARNLEHLFRRFHLSQHTEIQQIGQKIFDLIKEIAPSIILFPTPSRFEQSCQTFSQDNLVLDQNRFRPGAGNPVILDYTQDADHLILAHLASMENAIPYSDAMAHIKRLTKPAQSRLYRRLMENLEFYDGLPRVFEIPQIVFQAVISASNYAQLKRHRMSTLLKSNYHPWLGITIPSSIQEVGLGREFKQLI